MGGGTGNTGHGYIYIYTEMLAFGRWCLLLLFVAVVAVVVLLVVVGAAGLHAWAGGCSASPPNPPPALRFLIWNCMTLFGFVFVVVSSCLLHCSSFVVAGGFAIDCYIVCYVIRDNVCDIILYFDIFWYPLWYFFSFATTVSYMMLFLVALCCSLLLVWDFVVYGEQCRKQLCKLQRGNDFAWWTLWVRFFCLFVIPNHEI